MTQTEPKADPTPEQAAPAAALHTGTSDIRTLLTRNLRQSGIYIAFVAIVALFAVLTDGTSLSPINITNIVLQYSYILVLAIGMVIVIIAGHIDLSVGSVVALTGAISAVLVIQQGLPWWVGVLAAIAPMSRVNASKPSPPSRPFRKPLATTWYSGVNGESEMLSRTCNVMPRNSSMPASVTMNAGMPT